MRLHINMLVADTFGWIFGARAFIEEIQRWLPEGRQRDMELARRLAQVLGWGEVDFQAERSDVESKFEYWIPRVAAYSSISLTYTIVETQLIATAEQLRATHGYKLKINELGGDPIDRAKKYLTKVADIDVGSDPAWAILTDLAKIRHIIVHRNGRPGRDRPEVLQGLARRYPGDILIAGAGGLGLGVSIALCNRMLDEVEGFFKRIFEQAGIGAAVESEQ